jgi:hypothetical protein
MRLVQIATSPPGKSSRAGVSPLCLVNAIGASIILWGLIFRALGLL